MAQAQSVGFGVAAFAVLFQMLVYCAIAFVIWKFYQMIAKIGEDVAAIRAIVKRQAGVADHDLDLDFEIPPDPLA